MFNSFISTVVIEHFFMLGILIDTGDKIICNLYDTISVPMMQMAHETWKVYIWLLVIEETLGQLHVVHGGSISLV